MKIADQSFPRQKILLITYTIQSCYNHENKNQKYSQSLQSTILRIFHENSHKSQRLFLIDRLETIVNELFHYNNFLVDQLENWESIYIIPLCYNHEKQSQKTSLKSFPHLPIGKGVNRLYIYIPLDAKIRRPYFSREQLHTFPVDRLENVFEKRQTFRRFSRKQRSPNNETRIGSFSKAGKASPHWETLTDRERHHCGGNFSEILDPGDDLFGCKWKKKNFHARVSIPLPSIPQFFPLFDEESATFQLVNRLPLTFH